jgi:hypothetical protein
VLELRSSKPMRVDPDRGWKRCCSVALQSGCCRQDGANPLGDARATTMALRNGDAYPTRLSFTASGRTETVSRRASDELSDGPDRSDRDGTFLIGGQSAEHDVQRGLSPAKSVRASGHSRQHNRPNIEPPSCFRKHSSTKRFLSRRRPDKTFPKLRSSVARRLLAFQRDSTSS